MKASLIIASLFTALAVAAPAELDSRQVRPHPAFLTLFFPPQEPSH